MESRALNSFLYGWHLGEDQDPGSEAFTVHNNAVNRNIKFSSEDAKENRLDFLDYAVVIGKGRILQV